jgi:hypothetical protein
MHDIVRTGYDERNKKTEESNVSGSRELYKVRKLCSLFGGLLHLVDERTIVTGRCRTY